MSTEGPDAGLRALLRKHLGSAQWTTVESGALGTGAPDCEYCLPGGAAGWIECKRGRGPSGRVHFRPAQIGWLLRRAAMGGRCWVAVRWLWAPARPRPGKPARRGLQARGIGERATPRLAHNRGVGTGGDAAGAGAAMDELWLVGGRWAPVLRDDGLLALPGAAVAGRWAGGPTAAGWCWREVEQVLRD